MFGTILPFFSSRSPAINVERGHALGRLCTQHVHRDPVEPVRGHDVAQEPLHAPVQGAEVLENDAPPREHMDNTCSVV